MNEEPEFIGFRTVSRRGGSLSITIDAELARRMDIKPGDSIALFFDAKNKRIVIEKIESFITSSGFSFSISKETIKKLLKGKEKTKE